MSEIDELQLKRIIRGWAPQIVECQKAQKLLVHRLVDRAIQFLYCDLQDLNGCESEIEKEFLSEFLVTESASAEVHKPYYLERHWKDSAASLTRERRFDCITSGGHLIYPQTKIGKYRVDFLVTYIRYDIDNLPDGWSGFRASAVVVECDGHDYHDRTKQQAARDKARDRFITSIGIPVFRFTGSEIHHNPKRCVDEVIGFLRSSGAELTGTPTWASAVMQGQEIPGWIQRIMDAAKETQIETHS